MNLILYMVWTFLLLGSIPYNEEAVDNKYLQAIIYLKINKDINDKMKKAYPSFTDKKSKFVELNISNRIEYLDIYHFQSDLRKDNCGIDSIYIEDIHAHEEEYSFPPFYDERFRKIIPPNKGKLYLIFSKPIDNYLIARIIFDSPEALGHQTNVGKVMPIFFKFDEEGLIEKVFYTFYAYN